MKDETKAIVEGREGTANRSSKLASGRDGLLGEVTESSGRRTWGLCMSRKGLWIDCPVENGLPFARTRYTRIGKRIDTAARGYEKVSALQNGSAYRNDCSSTAENPPSGGCNEPRLQSRAHGGLKC